MAEYYLISQLPSLDGLSESAPLPITEERFLELCKDSLGDKLWSEVKGLTLVPEIDFEQSGYAVVNSWNENERNLRLALAKVRAEKLGKTFDLQNKNLPAELIKTANAAVETENPLEAEIFLLSYRLGFLETLRPLNTFSEDYLFYYALKLKLIARIRQFDTNLGKTTYKDIYDSILDGDRLEA